MPKISYFYPILQPAVVETLGPWKHLCFLICCIIVTVIRHRCLWTLPLLFSHLLFTRWIKLKSQKPCPLLFGSTVISVRGWQAKDINLKWCSWNYTLQTGECSFMTLHKEMISWNCRTGWQEEEVFREQGSSISGQKYREEWWLFTRGSCNVTMRTTALFNVFR